MAPRLRTFLLNAGLVAASLAATLALLEAAMWLIHPPPSPYSLPRGLMTQASGVWTLTPNFRGTMDNRVDFRGKVVSTDARGVRQAPPAAGEPLRQRLFVLGDSQTFGHGLNDEETWPAQLQILLDQRHRAVRVENWGVPGINIDQYAERLRRVLAEARVSDMVLVGMSWNDLITSQNLPGALSIVEGYLVNTPAKPSDPGATRERSPATEPQTDPNPAAAARIRFYDYTGIVVPPFHDVQQFAEALAANSALAAFLMPRLRALWHRWRSTTPLTQVVEAAVPDVNFWLLYNMREEAAAHGIRLVVVLLPERYFIDDAMYHSYSGGGRFFPDRNYMGYIARPLCQSYDIVCLDPFDALVDHNRREPVTYRIDGHYNPAGAAAVATVVAREIANLLP